MSKKNVFDTYDALTEHWSPQVVAEANGQLAKVAKIKGEFVWHDHANEDEIFLVLKGSVTVQYRDREDMTLNAGDIHTIPRGVEHCPLASEDCMLLLFEPAETTHTGDVVSEMTKTIEEQRAAF